MIPEFVSEIIAIVRQDTSHKLNKKEGFAYNREIILKKREEEKKKI